MLQIQVFETFHTAMKVKIKAIFASITEKFVASTDRCVVIVR